MGPLVTALEVRKAAQESLQKWLPAYLAEVGRRHGMNLRLPRTWGRLANFSEMKVDQSPAVLVTSPGWTESPHRDGDGRYTATWRINVFVIVRGKSYDETADLVALYAGAVRAALAQQGLEIVGAKKPRCDGEGYDELRSRDKTRTIGAGMATFTVTIGGVLDDDAGPIEVPQPPDFIFPEDPIAQETNIELVANP